MDSERNNAHLLLNPLPFYLSLLNGWRKNASWLFFRGLWKSPPLPHALLCSKQLKIKNNRRAGKSGFCCDNVAFRNNGVPLAWALFGCLSTQLHLLCRAKYFLEDLSVVLPSILTCSFSFSRCFEWPPIWTADLVWAHMLWGGIDLLTVAGFTVPQ